MPCRSPSLPSASPPLAWLVASNWFSWYRPSLTATLALYAALFVLLYNSLPSRQDLRVAFNWKSILIYLPALPSRLVPRSGPPYGAPHLSRLTSFMPTF